MTILRNHHYGRTHTEDDVNGRWQRQWFALPHRVRKGTTSGRQGHCGGAENSSPMAFCCHLTRRDFLRWASLVAATPLLVQLEQRPARATGGVVAINLELVTLTETSVILTWFTGDPTQVDSMGRLAPRSEERRVGKEWRCG